MEFRLRPLGFMEFFLQNNNHQAVNKILEVENINRDGGLYRGIKEKLH